MNLVLDFELLQSGNGSRHILDLVHFGGLVVTLKVLA